MKRAPNRHRQGEKLIAATVWPLGSTKVKGLEVFLTERQWTSAFKRKSFMGYRIVRLKRGHASVKQTLAGIRRKLQAQRELPNN